MRCRVRRSRTSIVCNSPILLSKTVGKHTFKAGVDVNVIHELLINLFQGGGVYSYNGSVASAFQWLGG